jgi:hypothetical protein
MAAKMMDKPTRIHRKAARQHDKPVQRILEPEYKESTVPGREMYYARCPKCKQIIHIERPLPHGPRSEMFTVYAHQEMARHRCP